MPVFDEEKRERKLAQLRRKEEEETVKMLSEKYGLPYADLATIPVNVGAIALVPEPKAREAQLAVIQAIGRKLEIAVANPEDPRVKDVLEGLGRQRYTWSLFLVSHTSLEKTWTFYAQVKKSGRVVSGEIQVSGEVLENFRAKVKNLTDIARLVAGVERKSTTDILEIIIAGALQTNTSDIHLEPQSDRVRLRYRIDGLLADAAFLPAASYRFLLSRVKLIAEMKLNVKTRGQDGRFTIKAAEGEIEVRASTLPGPYGENVVLRVLNPTTIAVEFDGLGMQAGARETMTRELTKPNGMILTTGPTGSGKTTTLYAFLRKVSKPGIKIITLEDPIEYHLAGIEQTQIEAEAGYDFASGLRSILRQDPDVILVGEIRDLETAQTAMHASLTGHLVFSTLHTNDAAGTLPRLLDLGVGPAILAPAINVAMAQRLLRRLCRHCKTESPATPEERKTIERELSLFPPNVPPPPLPEALTLAKAAGCSECFDAGYKGRTGVFEIIIVDDTVEQLIFKKPSEVDVRKAARAQGQITMRQDGVLKVLAGITDFAEVERVVGSG